MGYLLTMTVKAKGVSVSNCTLAFWYELDKLCSVTISFPSGRIDNIYVFISSVFFFNVQLWCIFFLWQQNDLDMVPQPVYSKEQLVMPSGPLKDRDWDLGDQQSILDGGVSKNLETDDFGRYSAISSRWAESKWRLLIVKCYSCNHQHLLVGSDIIESPILSCLICNFVTLFWCFPMWGRMTLLNN